MTDLTAETERPVVFGEVLFDVFPGGESVLGGAPFNVAWHLQGFGLEPVFISRIGMDANGEKVLEQMQAWGMETTGMQWDRLHPTGRVEVGLSNGQPSFTILPEQAYDYIDPELASRTLAGNNYSLLYHGSLINRSTASREALIQLHEKVGLPVFLDINLRSPWWDISLINKQLSTARWAKMNDDELVRIASDGKNNGNTLEQTARQLCLEHHLETLLITCGAKGAFLVEKGQASVFRQAIKVPDLVDTVGAGDAFSAVMMIALIRQWPPDLALGRAGEFAAEICGRRGATLPDKEIYQQYTSKWVET